MKTLTPQEAAQLWKHLGPGILRAVTRNGPPSGLFLRDLMMAIGNGSARVLVGEDGFGVVFVEGEVCTLIAYEGTLREIKLLKKDFVAMAKAFGCNTIRITGDPAWMRVVPELTIRSVNMEMKI